MYQDICVALKAMWLSYSFCV